MAGTIMHPWVAIPGLILLLTNGVMSYVKVVGMVGQPVVLPCTYTGKAATMCWGRGPCPWSRCTAEMIWTNGYSVTYQQSPRYSLKGNIRSGNVSLTIDNPTVQDSGLYCCRIERKGWFNDRKLTISLEIKPAPLRATIKTMTTWPTTTTKTTRPTITTKRTWPTTTTKTTRPTTTTKRTRPTVTTKRTRPTVTTKRTRPTVTTKRTRPTVTTKRTRPTVTTKRTRPTVTTKRTRPTVTTKRTRPTVTTKRTRPTVTTKRTRPTVTTKRTRPTVTTKRTRPTVTTKRTRPTVTTKRTRPTVTTKRTRPTVTTKRTRPTVTTKRTRPTVTTKRTRPTVTTKRTRPTVTTKRTWPTASNDSYNNLGQHHRPSKAKTHKETPARSTYQASNDSYNNLGQHHRPSKAKTHKETPASMISFKDGHFGALKNAAVKHVRAEDNVYIIEDSQLYQQDGVMHRAKLFCCSGCRHHHRTLLSDFSHAETTPAASEIVVTAFLGQSVTLPCIYSSWSHHSNSMCWGKGQCPKSRCTEEFLYTDGSRVLWKKSAKYALQGSIGRGDISLTIFNTNEGDSGVYCCRVEVPGWFNDVKKNIRLQLRRAVSIAVFHREEKSPSVCVSCCCLVYNSAALRFEIEFHFVFHLIASRSLSQPGEELHRARQSREDLGTGQQGDSTVESTAHSPISMANNYELLMIIAPSLGLVFLLLLLAFRLRGKLMEASCFQKHTSWLIPHAALARKRSLRSQNTAFPYPGPHSNGWLPFLRGAAMLVQVLKQLQQDLIADEALTAKIGASRA
ncbi:hypothetical protein CB1_000265008 [Camelus ferus]|nr:hypothetical protein CB1_000265008 [Camelus ferus]